MTAMIDLAAQFEGHDSLTISGSSRALKDLGDVLAAGRETVIELPPIAPASPYIAAAAAIRVRQQAEPGITISRERSDVVIAGHEDSLAILGSNISNFGKDPAGFGGHIHEEYFEGHFYFRPDSIPVLVEATDDDGPTRGAPRRADAAA